MGGASREQGGESSGGVPKNITIDVHYPLPPIGSEGESAVSKGSKPWPNRGGGYP